MGVLGKEKRLGLVRQIKIALHVFRPAVHRREKVGSGIRLAADYVVNFGVGEEVAVGRESPHNLLVGFMAKSVELRGFVADREYKYARYIAVADYHVGHAIHSLGNMLGQVHCGVVYKVVHLVVIFVENTEAISRA